MKTISIELVPCTSLGLGQDLATAKQFTAINAVNIPHLIHRSLHPLDVVATVKETFSRVIPHIRANDIAFGDYSTLESRLKKEGIKEILVIQGDVSPQFDKPISGTTTLQAIKQLRKRFPKPSEMQIYAAIDPYRRAFRHELDYALQKIEAGADGFFSQPFFDWRFLEMYAEQFHLWPVFWGITPVVTTQAKVGYWETKNHVVFPSDFTITLKWNQTFAQKTIELLKNVPNQHVYLMPIKVDIREYLSGVLV